MNSDTQMNLSPSATDIDVQHRSTTTKVFLGLLAGVGILYGVVLAYHVVTPLPKADAAAGHWLEQCRQICAQYGLVTSGNIREDAEAYLEVIDNKKLSAPLEELLTATGFDRAETQDHSLIGTEAPGFTLLDSSDQPRTLASLKQQGPVVLVFYYGYNCSHCVAQLFALQEDLKYFHELGAEVVAISADSPEFTRQQVAEYGGFSFPVLSDPDYAVSETWGVHVRPTETEPEDLLHGTFVIDRQGKVVFANRGYEPFLDNQSLLLWLADQKATRSIESSATARSSD